MGVWDLVFGSEWRQHPRLDWSHQGLDQCTRSLGGWARGRSETAKFQLPLQGRQGHWPGLWVPCLGPGVWVRVEAASKLTGLTMDWNQQTFPGLRTGLHLGSETAKFQLPLQGGKDI